MSASFKLAAARLASRLPPASLIIGAFALFAFAAPATDQVTAAPPIDDPLRNALSGIDYVAEKGHLDNLLGEEAAQELIAIARNPDGDLDPGVRIRAYEALALYPEETLPALLEAVDEHTSPLIEGGVEIVLAKAAMNATARVARATTPAQAAIVLTQLGEVIGHPVLDMRASAARTLGRSGIDDARTILESRLTVETQPLVREAIRRALLDLGRF